MWCLWQRMFRGDYLEIALVNLETSVNCTPGHGDGMAIPAGAGLVSFRTRSRAIVSGYRAKPLSQPGALVLPSRVPIPAITEEETQYAALHSSSERVPGVQRDGFC